MQVHDYIKKIEETKEVVKKLNNHIQKYNKQVVVEIFIGYKGLTIIKKKSEPKMSKEMIWTRYQNYTTTKSEESLFWKHGKTLCECI